MSRRSNGRKIPYAWHSVGDEEIAAVTDVLRNGPLTCGDRVRQFEDDFASWTGTKCAIAVSSGTAALEIALEALEIGSTCQGRWADKKEGFSHEVIVPSLTMAATAIAVIRAGARPRFADIDSQTLQLDVKSVESLINPRTRAIIVVHYGGQPAPLESILALAERHKVEVIEDAAHAFGTSYADMPGRVGSCSSTVACFSFHPCKNITTGEGGMIATGSQQLAARCRRLRWFGLEKAKNQPCKVVSQLGMKANLTDIHAAIGIEQLKKAEGFIARRKEIAKRYHEAFASQKIPDMKMPQWDLDKCSWHLFPALFWRKRDHIKDRLANDGIETAIHYHPVHMQPWFKLARTWLGYRNSPCPESEAAAQQELSLPMWPGLTDEDVDYIVEAVARASTPKTTKRDPVLHASISDREEVRHARG